MSSDNGPVEDRWLDAEETEPVTLGVAQPRRRLLVAGLAIVLLLSALVASRQAAGNAQTAAIPSQAVGRAFGLDPAIAYDQATHQVILFNDDGQTWLWSGTHWSLRHPPRAPSARNGAVAAWDPITGKVLLFGGRARSSQFLRDTWQWNGSTWARLSAGPASPPGGTLAMGFDPSRQRVVLIVTPPGQDQSPQVWTWDRMQWHEANVKTPGA